MNRIFKKDKPKKVSRLDFVFEAFSNLKKTHKLCRQYYK